MKRPLCCVCLAYVVTVFIYLILNPIKYFDVSRLGKDSVKIMGEVYQKEYKNGNLVVSLKNIKLIDQNGSYKGKRDLENVMCYFQDDTLETEPCIGAQIAVSGKISSFNEARNPGEFDAKKYYRILGIDARLYKTVILAQGVEYSVYRETLYKIRRYLESVYDSVLNEKDASIMKAMVLGNKSEIDYDSKQLFQKSGVAHIFAISGLHITFLGMGLYSILKKIRIPTVISCVAVILLMIVYGDMVGMSSSAYRAVFMFGLRMAAKLCKRTYDMLTAISVSAVLILLEQPLYLFHSGFLLSFGAVIGIACLAEVVFPIFSVFLVHFPIMLSIYYEFPIYSFLINLVIIPAMTFILAFGVGILFVGSIPLIFCLGMAKLGGLVCHLMLEFFEILCTISASLPQSEWIVGRPDSLHIIVFMVAVTFLYFAYNYSVKSSKKGTFVILPMKIRLILILVAVAFVGKRPITQSSINFIDVGQGDSIFIEGKNGEHFLVDGGSTSKSKVGQYTLVPYLKYMGVSRLDMVFLTHLDSDHISGILEILEKDGALDYNIEIGGICISNSVIEDDEYYNLLELCSNKKIPVHKLKAGDYIEAGDISFEVLHPDVDYVADSKNAYSLVMKLSIGSNSNGGKVTALLTGDVSDDGERAIADSMKKIDIYKAAHHGSKYSNTKELVDAASPSIAVFSCSEGNSYGHPHKEAVENFKNTGSNIYVTKDTGTIMIKVKNGNYYVDTYLKD